MDEYDNVPLLNNSLSEDSQSSDDSMVEEMQAYAKNATRSLQAGASLIALAVVVLLFFIVWMYFNVGLLVTKKEPVEYPPPEPLFPAQLNLPEWIFPVGMNREVGLSLGFMKYLVETYDGDVTPDMSQDDIDQIKAKLEEHRQQLENKNGAIGDIPMVNKVNTGLQIGAAVVGGAGALSMAYGVSQIHNSKEEPEMESTKKCLKDVSMGFLIAGIVVLVLVLVLYIVYIIMSDRQEKNCYEKNLVYDCKRHPTLDPETKVYECIRDENGQTEQVVINLGTEKIPCGHIYVNTPYPSKAMTTTGLVGIGLLALGAVAKLL